MHFSSKSTLFVVRYSPRKTDGGRRRASVRVGTANTKNVICTSNKAFDVDACQPVAMLARHPVVTRRASTSKPMTSLCVKIHCVASALPSMTYRYFFPVSHVRVREMTSILSILFPIRRL